MINRAQLQEARRRVAEQFVRQCEHGVQSRGLPADVAACGQYLNSLESPQRGLHGTAAAVRVLAQQSPNGATRLIPRLVRYVVDRREIEQAVRPPEDFSRYKEQLERDDKNVIKMSEVLYGLHFVPNALAPTDDLTRSLAEKLQHGLLGGQGWGYFLNDRKPQLLPTAFAIRALAQHGYAVEGPVKYVLRVLTSPQPAPERSTDITVRAFCVFVLAFGRAPDGLADQGDLKPVFQTLWRRLDSLLDEDFEQTIEYAYGERHCYVRIPWQLYLLALAVRLAPRWAFASVAAQRRLQAVLTAIRTEQGFVYPHSGDKTSSRTNAILYDAFDIIESELLKHPVALWPANVADAIRSALSSRALTLTGLLVAAVVMVLSVQNWGQHGGNLGDLAPNFLSAILLGLMSLRKHR